MNRTSIVAKIEEIAERVAQPKGLEIVEIELKGSGRHQVLLIIIDKPEGVTHGDCEFISHEVGAMLDVEDVVHGAYSLEVSSPGVERKLLKWKDWERFVGQKVKVVLREPILVERATPVVEKARPQAKGKPADDNGLKHFDGVIASAQDETIAMQLADDSKVTFPFAQVDRANLKFEW